MISRVIVTNRADAPMVVRHCKEQGPTCWITICNPTAHPLVQRSSKHILVCKFNDVPGNPITNRQKRKIKNFIMNHHVNMKEHFTLVINCHAGISRSAGVGAFCKHNLGIPVAFGPETFPNVGVMQALGVHHEFWRVDIASRWGDFKE